MFSILSLLKSKPFLAGQGLLALILLVVFLGPRFGLPRFWIMAIVMAILMIGVILLLVGYVRASRSSNAIQQSIRAQAEQQRMSARPDRQAQIDQLQRDLEEAIERLKQSKLGRGKRGKAALYALPWYMMIGPPASGKTTAIKNSGLNFPIGDDAFRGVGGTRNCDWFFSDSAIILDTAGRYMTEDEDSEEWNTFLHTLKENRKKQPINGVVVAISINELADASPEQVDWHASTIRRRIDDLVARLEVTFPVYLLFTKCDLLRGFVQFFGDMTLKEREQVWGSTFTQDQWDSPDLRALFDSEFNILHRTLLNWRNVSLSRSLKRSERQVVYVFPIEFAAIRSNLSHFIGRLFQRNPYRDTPSFRGFYFSSGTQEGVPIDRVIRAIAGQFGLPAASIEDSEEVVETKTYFVRNLFDKVVIPDRFLVSQTSRAAVRGRVFKAGVAVVAAMLLGLFIIGSIQALVRSQGRLDEVLEASRNLSQVDVDARRATTQGDLELLESVLGHYERLGDWPVFSMGLDRSGDLRAPVGKILFGKTRALVESYPFAHGRSRIERAVDRSFLEDSEKQLLEEDFKAYLLLTSKSDTLKNQKYKDYLRNWLVRATDSSRVARRQESGAGERLAPVFTAFVDALSADQSLSFDDDAGLQRDVTRKLSEPMSIGRLYSRLERQGKEEFQTLSLRDIVRSGLFASDPELSEFFTIKAWEDFVEEALDDMASDPGTEEWMGIPPPAEDAEQIKREMTQRYFEAYAAEWLRLLREVRFESFRDAEDAAEALQILGGDESPVLYLLARVTSETKFRRSAVDAAGDLLSNEDPDPGNLVEQRFRHLHDLNVLPIATGGEADRSFSDLLLSLANLGDKLESRREPADLAEFAVEVLEDDGGELEEVRAEVQRTLLRLPEVQQLFEEPLQQTWDVILAGAQSFLNEEWRLTVYRPFADQLEGRYPFGPAESQAEAAIDDFRSFFQPESGNLATYRAEVLSPFLRSQRAGRLEPELWQKKGIRISAQARDLFERAETIQKALFQNSALRFSFKLLPLVPLREPDAPFVSRYILYLGGEEMDYGMGGVSPKDIVWDGTSTDASLRVETRSVRPSPIEERGTWAMFRLFARAEIEKKSSTNFELRWPVYQGIEARYEVSTTSEITPFTGIRDFFNIRVPARLGG